MEEIQNFLAEDEKILWKRSKIRNVLSIIPFAFYLLLGLNSVVFLITFLLLFFNLVSWDIIIWSVIILIIGFDVFLVIYVIYSIERMKKRLQLSNKELKRYEEFEIITNKHFIRKNYDLNYDKDFLKYSKGVLEKTKDMVFLNLDLIYEVWFSPYQEKIFLKVHINEGDTNFYFGSKNHKFDEIIKIFKDTLKKDTFFGEAYLVC